MRPLELELSGFRSHREPTIIDFSGRTLVAIVGPIGAGKSSILDGICFALYGKSPKIQREPSRLICSHSESAHVRLRFSVDGDDYEVERLMPRKGNGEHVLTDLASGDKTIGSSAVGKRIEELLGLSFPAFCSSILLAQGQFDEFLHATPTERTKILKGVFRFDQITALHSAARTRVGALNGELEGVRGELRGIGEDVVERLEAERERHVRLENAAGKLQAAMPEEQRLEEHLRAAADTKKRAAEHERAARDALAEVPSEHDLQTMSSREVTATGSVEAAEKELAAASTARAKADEVLVVLRAESGDEMVLRSALRTSEDLEAATGERAHLEGERSGLAEKVVALEADATATAEAARAAEAAHGAAAEKRSQAERADMAHALKAHLEPGMPCPVCERPVETIPEHDHKPELARLKKEEKGAASAAERARALATRANESLGRGRLDSERVDKELRSLVARIEKVTKELVAVLGAQDDFAGAARTRLSALELAAGAVEKATAVVEEVRAALERTRLERDAVAKGRRAMAAVLIRLSTRAEVAAPDVDCSAGELSESASNVRASLAGQVERGVDEAARADETAASARRALIELRAPFDLADDVRIETALAETRAHLRNAADRVAGFEKDARRASELEDEAAALEARTAVYQRLTDDLRDTNFVNFLLEERRRLLAELGSELLREMTGRYRFSDDAEFDVVDEMAADRRRDVETLSGGETFLASLALSLALAEAVTREGGRLESFFLDEGFGTLDAEAFEHALEGIERIVVGDRLIGLVSHVPELALRVEDKIVLDKSDDGTTLVVSGASG
ncbi:MAG: AAA family ATPase [Actinomycetota bacterium]